MREKKTRKTNDNKNSQIPPPRPVLRPAFPQLRCPGILPPVVIPYKLCFNSECPSLGSIDGM
jgi:hypothetical protein